MLNQSGISKVTYGAPVQILAAPEQQVSVGCVIPQSFVTSADSNGKKIVKAGTPINIDLEATGTAASKADTEVKVSGAKPMNAVVLHDVDVTGGNANGTALIFGFINLNRVDTAIATVLKTAAGITGASELITLMKL